jgi:hypothetical protein
MSLNIWEKNIKMGKKKLKNHNISRAIHSNHYLKWWSRF